MAVSPKLVILWITYGAWILLFIVVVDQFVIWNPVLTKGTLVWGLTTGIAMFVGFTEAGSLEYFREELSTVLSVIVLVEFFLNVDPFPLWFEFLLQPILFFFTVAPVVAREPEQQKTSRRVRNWIFLILVLAIVVKTAQSLSTSWQTLNWKFFALQAVWPMLLGVWVLVLVFPLAIFSSYENAFVQLRTSRDNPTGLWKAKLGLILALRLRLKWIREASKGGSYEVANAESVSGAYEAAKHYKADLVAEERQEVAYQENLVRYAGSTELNEGGRPRDKREFRESARALKWLHTCQMGWYEREPEGYKPNLIERFGDDFTRSGLDIPSGITLEVSDDGERWYAWRRTPGGHCFAIGASKEPPSEWLYDGPEPPQDFPGIGSEWGDSPFSMDECPNWYP